MGRNRKTVAELKLSGEFGKHGNRKDWNQEVPDPIGRDFKIPAGLLPHTRNAYRSFMYAKTIQGILSTEDEPLVFAMFSSLDSYLRITEQIAPILKNKEEIDLDQIDKLSKIQRRYLESFTALAIKFGLSPTERSKLSLPVKKEPSPMMKILQEVAPEIYGTC